MKIGLIMALTCAVFLSGCSTANVLKSTEPQQTVYTLRPLVPAENSSDLPARVLEIALSALPPGMDTDRIALFLADGQKLDYYAAARWSAPLRRIVQDVTRRNASAVLPYVVAVTTEQGMEADFRLQVKVNELQPVYEVAANGIPLLKANVEFALVHANSDKLISSFTLSMKERARENKLDAITLGLERMLQDIEREAFTRLDGKLRATK
jgi:ABC-type uncharacterized transport system auxiliary subunit